MSLVDDYNKAYLIIRDKGYALTCPDQGAIFILPNEDFDALYDVCLGSLGDHNGIPFFKLGKYVVRREEPYDYLLEELWIDKSIHRS